MSRMPRSLSRRSLLGAGGTLSLLALAACGGSGGGGRSGQTFDQVDGDTPEEYAERQRVVTCGTRGAGKSGEELVRQQQLFNESQEEFYVEVQTFDGYDGVDTRIATALQARAIPDLAGFGETTWHRLFLNEVLEPLDAHFDDEWNAETYQPAHARGGPLQRSGVLAAAGPLLRRCSTTTRRSSSRLVCRTAPRRPGPSSANGATRSRAPTTAARRSRCAPTR